MVRSIRGRKCHVSLQPQSLLCPADIEGTLSPAPLVSLRLHDDVRSFSCCCPRQGSLGEELMGHRGLLGGRG